MLNRLDHVTVRSTDIERTARFYQGVLGFKPGPRPAFELPGCWLYLQGEPVLHVVQAPTGVAGGVIDHFALVAADLRGIAMRLIETGVSHELRAARGGVMSSVHLLDPDGVRVELVQSP